MKDKFGDHLLVEDKLFAEYIKHKKELNKAMDDIKKDWYKEQSLNKELQKKINVLEEVLAGLESNNRDEMAIKIGEFGKKLAISEAGLIKMSRKYEALEQDYKQTNESYKKANDDNSEYQRQLMEKLCDLKKWKNQAVETIKIL